MEKDMEDLMKRYEESQKFIGRLTEQIKLLEKEKEVLVAQKKQWDEQKVLQGQIVAHQIGNSDSVVQQLQNEIMSIKRKYNIKD